jgi:trigger factor
MQFSVSVEKPSNILRKLNIKVPAAIVANRYERGLAEVQKTARLKGFRPGQAPISVIRQFYGEDVRHRVFHNLIDEFYKESLRTEKLRAIGSPKIDTPDHKTGDGEHDHTLKEDQDLNFTATVEILPEIEVKNYTGIALTEEKTKVGDADVQKIIDQMLDSQAQLEPIGGGLVGADGKSAGRAAQTGDFADLAFDGGIVNADGTVKSLPGMKGSRVVELGSNSLIPGFEEQVVGMRGGETKTFKIPFPADYHEKELAGKDSQFTVTVNELKQKKLPTLDDEFVKQMGYEGVADLKAKALEHLEREAKEGTDRKLRNDLVAALIEKNPFDVPAALIEAQTRALAQEWAGELKQQGVSEQVIQNAIGNELDSLRKRAESQVRSSLIFEAIAKKEGIELKNEQLEEEISKAAASMQIEPEKLKEYYAKNPARQDDFEFRLKQESTVKFLLDKAKIKSKS